MSAKLSALVDMRVIYCGDNRDQIRSAVSEIYVRSEEHTSELQSQSNLVCRLLLEKKNRIQRPRGLRRQYSLLDMPKLTRSRKRFQPRVCRCAWHETHSSFRYSLLVTPPFSTAAAL